VPQAAISDVDVTEETTAEDFQVVDVDDNLADELAGVVVASDDDQTTDDQEEEVA